MSETNAERREIIVDDIGDEGADPIDHRLVK